MLQALDATAVWYKEMLAIVMTQIRVSDVFKLLLNHLRDCNIEEWMLSGTARVMEYAPVHFVAEQLLQLVLSIIFKLSCNNRMRFPAIFFWQRHEYTLENIH